MNSNQEEGENSEQGKNEKEILEKAFSVLPEEVKGSINLRKSILLVVEGNLVSQNLDAKTQRKLANTESFVEEAQFHLTVRAKRYENTGKWLLALSLLVGIAFVVFKLTSRMLNEDYFEEINALTTTGAFVYFMERLLIGGIVIAAIAVPVSLARAFFHELTVLFSRRHALRSGRMHVFNNEGELDIDDAREAYSWNIMTSSAFQKIKPEDHVKSGIGGLVDAVRALTDSVANLIKSTILGVVEDPKFDVLTSGPRAIQIGA